MKIIYIIITIGLSIFNLHSQNVYDIKKDHEHYFWGEGSDDTMAVADNEALAMLISQIAVNVTSKFEHVVRENVHNGQTDFSSKVNSLVSTYSNATLKNAGRFELSEEPNAKVFRYIKREDVNKVFAERKGKINNLIGLARKAELDLRIADALRYYYSALLLLKSHPDCNTIKYTDENNLQQLVLYWVPAKMNEIFSNINFSVRNTKVGDKAKTVYFNITYRGRQVNNFDYTYWDRSALSYIHSAKNGIGILEFYGTYAADISHANIKAVYVDKNMANIDDELKNVMEQIIHIPFSNCEYYFNFDMISSSPHINEPPVYSNIACVDNSKNYDKAIVQVIDAIEDKDYQNVRKLFTKAGYNMFDTLIAYGNATIMDTPNLKVYTFNDEIMCRSVKMNFKFKNNYKGFTEDVVFHFNRRGKIESLSFGLSRTAFNNIFENNTWNEVDRLVLINFLEHFKTAYALKRIKYLETLFADDALIITGRVVKLKPGVENRYVNNEIVTFNQQTKVQYFKNLTRSFNSKEYINIQFEESKVRKGGNGKDIYGVSIEQNYYSSNYGDSGYLFLIVDLTNKQKPIIHVRTWQPHKDWSANKFTLPDF